MTLHMVTILPLDEDQAKLARSGFAKGVVPIEEGDYLLGLVESEVETELINAGLILTRNDPASRDAGEEAAAYEDTMTLDDMAGGADTAGPVILTLERPLTSQDRKVLDDAGLTLESRLSNLAYVLKATGAQSADLEQALPGRVRPYGMRETLCDCLYEQVHAGLVSGDAFDDALLSTTVLDDFSGPADGPFDPGVRAEMTSLGSRSAVPPGLDRGPASSGSGMEAAAVTQPEPEAYDVRCHDARELPAVARSIGDMEGVTDVQFSADRIRFWIQADEATMNSIIARLGALNKTSRMERYVPPEPLLEFATASTWDTEPVDRGIVGLSGAGQLVAVADTGFDVQHPDFEDRFDLELIATPESARDPDGHGTHVASIIAGSGAASDGRLAGMAPGARLCLQSLGGPKGALEGVGIGIKHLLQKAYDKGARIHNLSWGSPVASNYVFNSLELDEFVRANPDHLVIVAAGNSGRQSSDEPNRMQLESLYAPASAKNCLTVGACCSPRADGPYAGQTWGAYDGSNPPTLDPYSSLPLTGDPNIVAALSSRGPTGESRIKPDLVAPGVGIAAARSADSPDPRHPYPAQPDLYAFRSGTSMAAPLVAGAAALLREYLAKQAVPAPSAALMRAALVNGAVWMTGVSGEDDRIGSPNFHQGFGRLVLSRVFPLDQASPMQLRVVDIADDDPRALVAAYLKTGPSNWTGRILVQDAAEPLSITMAWTDPPGPGLSHELDLVVISPSRKSYIGNAGIVRPAWQGTDRSNNVEKVRVDDPETGEWRVQVHARNTFRGPQGFGLAVTGAVSDWIEP
ncbi:S8 family serine peptidase [Brevundimonas sp.]|uniref:S8 family serine peptidase n=1 Tax=Brevundimonas sp. TaxID=1871086 RepID=UPI002D739984|nr:S8 family serine peptidase [Brevundimonas sp.]HYC96414.1 S8 family serine peptidase [Brevundimonas sp.]